MSVLMIVLTYFKEQIRFKSALPYFVDELFFDVCCVAAPWILKILERYVRKKGSKAQVNLLYKFYRPPWQFWNFRVSKQVFF